MNIFEELKSQESKVLIIAEEIQMNKDRPSLAIACNGYKDKLQLISFMLLEIKEEIDSQYRIDKPKEILELRSFILNLYELSNDLYRGINQEDDNLVRRYSKEILEVLN